MSTSRPEETPSRARLDASMTLLNEVRRRPLDPGYAAAARARAQGRAKPRTIAGRVLIFVLAVALGLTGVWAARELRIPAEDVPSASSVLAEELRSRSQVNDQLADEVEDLQEQIAAMQAQQLGSEADSILKRARNQAVWAGTVAVHGPGVTVTMRDSERAQRNSPGSEEERVQDSDLQVVVNGLWAAGAEAIAINGHRLTSQTAIRTAGDAILVDLQPLVSPYVISAIGDPNELRTNFARTAASAVLNLLAAQYSISSSVTAEDELQLPAGAGPPLRHVTKSS
ncbi:MAG TPA: DUF881 domain-containing protein [Ruania sp.]|nr:DUF881 domain-containing protein [Ruania sp.]